MSRFIVLNENDLKIIKGMIEREKGRTKNHVTKQMTTIKNPRNVRIGKTDAAIDQDSSGTVSIYAGTSKGSETDTGNNVEAYSRFGDIDDDVWVLLECY